ncbi:extracellular solute-binding protein [Lachnoanaerobaculum gingivalis]|uniref:extracellular solute-binding protein n=1 Tax=Lachnoanaerobaculum gingivalis TaxID=2490855 RepID=UPI0024A767B1|nr:extracellular solute-binding protein [Lachnoanaerobaculum gingivalis]WHE88035.1 extracellular solute-binding protein [Lachnoanaerobaculum gingivalis]
MNRKKTLHLFVIIFVVILVGCTWRSGKEKKQVVLTLWHVYGGQTDSPLNQSIDKFNETIGKEEGIRINVTSVTNTNTIHEAVIAAAKNEPGAAELPDMFVSYPKTVLSLQDKDILVDYKKYFTEDELDELIPEFVQEGIIDDKLMVFPVAKSTEILFVNRTLFERFAKETGAKEEDLVTWEGLFEMAKVYEKWTDDKTPDIPNDGENFFVHDYHFNYFQVGCESLGEYFFTDVLKGGKLAFGDKFRKIWEPYADAAISGGVWLRDGYATEPLRTGKAIVSVASSASVLYYEDIVTYENNISEPIEVVSYPVPVFEGGKKMVMQRGAGFCTVKSTPEREKAAALFLKWLTEPDNNIEFVVKAGYMPVTEKAFAQLSKVAGKLESTKYRSLYEAISKTKEEYTFYVTPQLSNYLDMEMYFEKNVRLELSRAKEEYKEALQNNEHPNKEAYIEEAYQNIMNAMQ